MRLEELVPNARVSGLTPAAAVTIVAVTWHGSHAVDVVYRTLEGRLGQEMLFRDDEHRLATAAAWQPWRFDGDGHLFRLAAEAERIRLAHLFDPLLAVHSSQVDPLPHQITAVYEAMLPRQPLRFLLADDPGAGKTIMAGLLMKELIVRGDLKRCLIVCPGSLTEQWQDELHRRFDLPFEIVTNDALEAARTGNYFLEHDLVIARLDKLSRSDDIQAKLTVPDAAWDLIVVDEAHKMAASFFGRDIKRTRRYKLGELLSGITRHFLLMSATPHNGKEADFQLFLALLDPDRFEGRFRDGVHHVQVGDLMRRMVKESLVKFDGRPLFPERVAYSVPYALTNEEAELYLRVTEYVKEQWDRAKALENDRRSGTVGFALTVLQRRLASSPAAIHESLRRRRERLSGRLRALEDLHVGRVAAALDAQPDLSAEDLDDLEDAPDREHEATEERMLDEATAARSLGELRIEIGILTELEALAQAVRRGGRDTKWSQLASLLSEIFSADGDPSRVVDHPLAPRVVGAASQKLVVFTEHRDTLNDLRERIASLLGDRAAVTVIHGSMGREARLDAQEAFRNDPQVKVLLATDAAGEGINLQRAHLMVNYDLPWNPNRLEQRFGRIHRIGQTEVCHLWNLVAHETREGDVYHRLLQKLEAARSALGGQVFDVLGKLVFDGKPLRELLIEAILYGDHPDVRARLDQVIDAAVDREHLRSLLDDGALAVNAMDTTEVARVRADMERAQARRLQPLYVEAFFLDAFRRLGGIAREREPNRYELTHVPAALRSRDRVAPGGAVQPRYERIAFEKSLLQRPGTPPATFVTPGHPLLANTLALTAERYGATLARGALLVDDRDEGVTPRALVMLEHAVVDGVDLPNGDRRVISRRLLFIERSSDGATTQAETAPYLDYRPLAEGELDVAAAVAHLALAPLIADVERRALDHALATVVPAHLSEVRRDRLAWIERTRAAVHERLTKEIAYWDRRSADLRRDEEAGKPNAKQNSQEADRRAQELQTRLTQRMARLDREASIGTQAPVVKACALVIPAGFLATLRGEPPPPTTARDTQASAARARAIVMQVERSLGHRPKDVETERRGYDIESVEARTGALRFIEVKGRVADADTITVTKNEITYALNTPDRYRLAIVLFHDDGTHAVHYVREPFGLPADAAAASVNYQIPDLLARAEPPA